MIFAITTQLFSVSDAQNVRVGIFVNNPPKKIVIHIISGAFIDLNGCSDCVFQPGDSIVVRKSVELVPTRDGYVRLVGDTIQRVISPGRIFIDFSGRRGRWQVVAEMSLEQWVVLTLSAESPETTDGEALRAMAVVLRSFAYSSRRRHKIFDLCDNTHCALLPRSFVNFEPYETAVRETRGYVLAWKRRPVATTMTAHCGGHTCPQSSLWNESAEWSVGVVDTFCGGYDWRYAVCVRDIPEEFPSPPAEWRFSKDDCGNIRSVWVGQKFSGFDFWNILVNRFGWGTIKSPDFNVSVRKDSVIFAGRGFGHRTGLCQTGAEKMAKKGYSWKKILQFYFPNLELVRMTR